MKVLRIETEPFAEADRRRRTLVEKLQTKMADLMLGGWKPSELLSVSSRLANANYKVTQER